MEESLSIIKNKGECLMNNKTKKVIVIFLSLLALGLIIYTVYYLLKNNSSEENAVNVNIEASESHAYQIDTIPIKDLNIKVTLDTLPEVKDVITTLDYKDFTNLFKTSKRSILVVTKTGCSYCEAFLPNLRESLTNLGINAYEVNISNLKNNENIGDFIALYGTPITYIIENGNVTHTFNGLTDTKTISAFLDLYYLR